MRRRATLTLRPKVRRPRRLTVENLEERLAPAAQPITVADPTAWGVTGVRASSGPSVSADGQLVAFQSDANDLVANDVNGRPDAFVYDRTTGQVTLVSVGLDGSADGIDGATTPVLSPDGRYVAFSSKSGNLLAGFTNFFGTSELYVRDLTTGTTELVSVAPDGTTPGNRGATTPMFSADSHRLAFRSNASNLVTGITFTNPYLDTVNLFVRDLVTDTTTLASVGLDGRTDADRSTAPAYGLSADGRYVAFETPATNLVPMDAKGIEQVYVRDVVAGTTTMVSVEKSGLAGAGGHNKLNAGGQVISADGRYVVFHSNAADIVTPAPGGTNSYLRDLATGTTILASAGTTGAGVGSNGSEVLSPDGRWVAFATGTNGVTPVPTGGKVNVYVRDVESGEVALASVNRDGTAGGNAWSGVGTFYDFPGGLSFSPDGRYLAFRSLATDLTDGVTTAGHRNLYARDLDAGTTLLLTPSTAGTDGSDGDSDTAVFSTDGRVVAFQGTAANLVAGDRNRYRDVFVRDLGAGTTAAASRRNPLLPIERTGNWGGSLAAATPDGRYVAFTAAGNVSGYQPTDLVQGVSVDAFSGHIFLRDRQTGAVQVVDVMPDGKSAPENSWGPAITPDGRYVAFVSQGRLVPGITFYSAFREAAIYRRDLKTGLTQIVSVNPAGDHNVNVNGGGEVAISADGRYVAFTSSDTSAVAGLTNPGGRVAVFLRDLQTGSTVLVSHNLANDGQLTGNSGSIGISANGRYVLFTSTATDLAANDTNAAVDVFRWDRTTGAVTLVSVGQTGTGPGNAQSGGSTSFPFDDTSTRPAMTPDGRYVVFGSDASDLVAGDANGTTDVFVRDLTAGTTALVSVAQAGGASANGRSGYGVISADSRRVGFLSYATNLTGLPDTNGGGDYFVRDLQQGATTLASVNAAGTAAGNGVPGTHMVGPYSGFPNHLALSADGRFVAFRTTGTDLVPDFADGNGSGAADLFVRDLQQAATTWVSIDASGTVGGASDNGNGAIFFSSDGSTVLFDTATDNLVGSDPNGTTDVFAAPVAVGSAIRGQVFNDRDADGVRDNPPVGPGLTLQQDATGWPILPHSPAIDPTAEATLSAWVKFDQVPSALFRYMTVIGKSGLNKDLDLQADRDDRFHFYVANSRQVASTTVVRPGVWYQVTATYKANAQIALYVNGVLEASGSIAGVTRQANGNPLGIGHSPYWTGRTLAGTVTEAQLWNRALTATEVQAGFDRLAAGTEPGLLFHLPYDVRAGAVAQPSAPLVNVPGPVPLPELGLPYWTAFVDANGNGRRDAGEAMALTGPTGQYALTNLAPGAYTVAVAPQPGYNRTLPATGTYRVTIPAGGATVTGMDFGEVQPLPDLAATGVTVAPAAAAPGQAVTVGWTVTNGGSVPATGSWQDAIFLSPTPTLGPGAVLVKTVSHVGGLAAGAQYAGTAAVPLTVGEGDWYVVVVADRRNQVDEGPFRTNRANNLAASASAVAVTIPALALDVPAADQFDAVGQDRSFKIALEAGATLLLSLTGSPAGASNRLFVRFGDPATTGQFDAVSPLGGGANPRLVVPVTRTGTYYVLVHSEAGPAGPFQLTASRPGSLLLQSSPGSVGNAGRATLQVDGVDLPPDATYTLEGPGGTRTAVAVRHVSPALAYATFDLVGLMPGSYLLRATTATGSTTLADAVQVTAGKGAHVVTSVIGPVTVRGDRDYQFIVEYANDGDADAPAPLLVVHSPTNTWMGLSPDDVMSGRNVQFLAVAQDGPAGVLRPGARYRVPVHFHTPPAGVEYEFELQVTDTTTADPVDWQQVREWLDEDVTALPEFPAVRARLQQQIGSTWGDYVAMLARNATALPAAVGDNTDPLALLRLEAERARAAVGTSITGVAPTADPLVSPAGTYLFATNATTGDVFTTRILADGSFVFPAVTPGAYEFSAEGLAIPNPPAVTVAAGQAVQGVSLALAAGATVFGRVGTAEDGSLLAGARVEVVGDATSNSAFTDDSGRYRLPGLTPGTYTLLVEAAGRAQTVVGGLTVGTADVAQDVSMPRESVVSGRVQLAAGGPTNGELTVSVSAADGAPFRHFSSHGTGVVFAVGGLPAGTYDVRLSRPGYVPVTIPDVTVAAGAAANLGTVALARAATITGSVSSSDPFSPAAGALVVAFLGSTPVMGARADAVGAFSFTDLPAGTYRVKVGDATGRSTEATVTVAGGQNLTGVQLQVSPGATLAGRVTDPVTGEPIAGMPVSLFTPDGSQQVTRTDDAGDYQFGRLPLGTYLIRLPLNGPSASATVNVTSIDPAPVAVPDLQPAYRATLSGYLSTAGGAPVEGGVVYLLQSGELITSAPIDATGKYFFLVERPGAFDLVAAASNASFAPVTGVAVADGSTVQQDLVSGTASLTVTVTDPALGPAGAVVRIALDVPGGPVSEGAVRVGADGVAVFENLAAGDYTVRVAGLENHGGSTSVTVAAGWAASASVVLAERASLEGTVTDPASAPVADALIYLRSTTDPDRTLLTFSLLDGGYDVDQVPPGTYDVTILAGGFEAAVRTGVSVAGTSTLDVQLAADSAELAGTVVDPLGRPIPGARVSVTDPGGQLLGYASTAADGTFLVSSATGANLVVDVAADAYDPIRLTGVTVAAGATVALGDVALEPVAQDPGETFPIDPQQALADYLAKNPLGPISQLIDAGKAALNLVKDLAYVAEVYAKMLEAKVILETRLKKLPPPPDKDCPDPACQKIYDQLVREFYKQEGDAKRLESVIEELTNQLIGLVDVFIGETANIYLYASPYFGLTGLANYFFTFGNVLVTAINTANDIQSAQSHAAGATKPQTFEQYAQDLTKLFSDAYSNLKNVLSSASELGKQMPGMALSPGLPSLAKWVGPALKGLAILAGNNPYRMTLETIQRVDKVREDFEKATKKFNELTQKVYTLKAQYDKCLADQKKKGHDCDCKAPQNCDPPGPPKPKGKHGGGHGGKGVGGFDPNHLIGPGAGDRAWVGINQTLPFTVQFENDPVRATAAAQDVVITVQLDPDLDWATFELGDFGFWDTTVDVPAGLQSFAARVPARNADGTPLGVDVSAQLNRDTGLVSWVFRSVDPATGDVPADPLAGFLPVNDATHRGEGSVSYTVRARADRPTGTHVVSQARIVFDTNPPLDTNVVDNTVDAGLPTGTAAALPHVSAPSFPVSWAGADGPGESGVATFDVYVSTDGGPWVPWVTGTAETSAVFDGVLGRRYAFAVAAVDLAGNRDPLPAPTAPEAVTRTPIFARALPDVAEDARNPAGTTVATLLGTSMSDADAGALRGVAVTGLVGGGRWEFSADGVRWRPLTGASEAAAFLLPDTYRVRFTPARDWVGNAGLVFRGWDRTWGTAGGRAAVPAPDPGAPFTADGGYGTVTITPVNDRPVLPARPAPALLLPTPKPPAATGPAQPVSALVRSATDADREALGVAVTGTTGTGTWQFSTDGGASWTDLPVVSPTAALLLGPDELVRFNPAVGAADRATLRFKAWDQSAGGRGDTADTTPRAATAFATRTATATTRINAAPVLAGPAVALTMAEDQAPNKGFLVDTLLAGRVTDDPKSLRGVALTEAATGGNGAWQYSVDGGRTWRPVAGLRPEAALLLRGTDRLRFVPTPDFHGEGATLTFKAWDQTFGAAGTTADVSTGVPGAFFSSASRTAFLTVTPVADRPVLEPKFAPRLASFRPGDEPTTGLVSDLVAASARGTTGLAIIGATGGGAWAFSIDAGTTWSPVGLVSAAGGLLLGGDALVRFTPAPEFRGTAALAVRGWSGTGGTAGAPAALAAMSPIYSNEVGRLAVSVNTAPTLGAGSPALPPVAEDTKAPAGAPVAALLGTLGTLATDPDAGALSGVAVTGLTGTANGSWQYSTTGGRKWLPVGHAADDAALLLRPTDRVRYVPNLNFHGSAGLTFRAWDQTTGAVGGRADTAAGGDSSAFSDGEVAAGITVTPVNDAPAFAPGAAPGKLHAAAATNPNGVVVGNLVAGWAIDPDGDPLGIAVTGLVSAGGRWEFSADGTDWRPVDGVSAATALLLAPTDRLRFVPAAGFNGTAAVWFRAWDQTRGVARTTAAVRSLGAAVSVAEITVPAWVNTAPVLAAQ